MPIVSAILEREIDLISDFIALLNEEQDSLKQADPTRLPEFNTSKSGLVEKMNALEGERMAAIGQGGSLSNRASMDSWLNQNATDTAAALKWNKLLDLAREAKNLHELNGSLIAMHLKNTAEVLAVLTQQASKPALYSANGQSLQATGSRIVDSA